MALFWKIQSGELKRRYIQICRNCLLLRFPTRKPSLMCFPFLLLLDQQQHLWLWASLHPFDRIMWLSVRICLLLNEWSVFWFRVPEWRLFFLCWENPWMHLVHVFWAFAASSFLLSMLPILWDSCNHSWWNEHLYMCLIRLPSIWLFWLRLMYFLLRRKTRHRVGNLCHWLSCSPTWHRYSMWMPSKWVLWSKP